MTTKNEPKVPADQPICGIAMPIAGTESPYTESHWRDVRVIIERAIAKSGLRAQPVWEQSTTDVIHSKIIANLYQNAVVVCDVSSQNPNVMLELGMRLSTKLPTIIISDMVERPPFDTALIEHLVYPVTLEYLASDLFIERLSDRIKAVHQSAKDRTYKSFVEQFTFETVQPTQVEVTADQYIMERLDRLASAISSLGMRPERPRQFDNRTTFWADDELPFTHLYEFQIIGTEEAAARLLRDMKAAGVSWNEVNRDGSRTTIRILGKESDLGRFSEFLQAGSKRGLVMELLVDGRRV